MITAVAPPNTLGVPLESYTFDLTHVPPEHAEEPPVDEGWHRFTDEQLARCWMRRTDFYEDRKHRIPYDVMAEAFTLDELSRLKWKRGITCGISGEWEKDASPYRVLMKIRQSMYIHDYDLLDYNKFVDLYRGIRSFQFQDFDVGLDWAYSGYGYSCVTRTYLDGCFGFLVGDRGQHVMTIGFSGSAAGILIAQVQLKQQKGNRWLYRLPCHYLDYTVNQIAAAFPGQDVWLVDGADLVNAINRSYQRDHPGYEMPLETRERIERFYSHELLNFQRGSDYKTDRRMKFWKLEPKG
jgi:hypothetical protein